MCAVEVCVEQCRVGVYKQGTLKVHSFGLPILATFLSDSHLRRHSNGRMAYRYCGACTFSFRISYIVFASNACNFEPGSQKEDMRAQSGDHAHHVEHLEL